MTPLLLVENSINEYNRLDISSDFPLIVSHTFFPFRSIFVFFFLFLSLLIHNLWMTYGLLYDPRIYKRQHKQTVPLVPSSFLNPMIFFPLATTDKRVPHLNKILLSDKNIMDISFRVNSLLESTTQKVQIRVLKKKIKIGRVYLLRVRNTNYFLRSVS